MNKLKEFLFKKRNLSRKSVIILLVISVLCASYITYDNFQLDTEYIEIETDKLSKSFDGFKIAHVSDFHNRENEDFDKKIIASLEEANPNIIVVTGDLVDRTRTNVKVALAFAAKLVTIAPVYYVMGNHEATVQDNYNILFNDMLKKLEAMGVTLLRNEQTKILLPDGANFNIYGLDEQYFYCGPDDIADVTAQFCDDFVIKEDEFNILLAHHPEQLPVYSDYDFDLVFSGHAHAGQFRIFGQGILAPDQGFFPEYTSGLYEMGETKLILSRGLGNSIFPFRLFNQSHLIITELKVL